MIVRWPGVVQAGAACDVPVISADYYPTFSAIAGASAPASHAVDGENITPLLKQSGALNREAVYWHYPHYHPGGATPYSAVRAGDFRLVEFQEDGRVELYNLKSDIGETRDLAAELPEKAAALRNKLHAWRKNVGAQMATPNPNADAEKDKPKNKR
jgi:arylsulfatase A-like enzyme